MCPEDILHEYYVHKHTLVAFKKYDAYESCFCKSGKKFKFCCKPLKKESKAWKMTRNIISDHLTKKKIESKIKAFEGAHNEPVRNR